MPMPRRAEPDPLSQAIGRRVRALRVERGKTLEKLAFEHETVSKGHLSDIENGRVNPTMHTLRSLADRLGVAVFDLVTFPEVDARSALVDATRGLTSASLDELLSIARSMPREEPDEVLPFRPVRPAPGDHYVTCIPLLGLDLAAGGFRPGPLDPSVTWVSLKRPRPLHRRMFVARVVGRSMEPRIPDGAYCLFGADPPGDLTERVLLVQQHGIHDADTGTSYTVKHLTRAADGRLLLRPDNRDFKPIELRDADAADLRVVAELLDVLTS